MSHCQSQSGCCSKGECGCHAHGCSGGSQQACGCQSKSCGCQSKNSGCGCKKCGCDQATKFLELADHAWMEVLKEKIKAHIQSQSTHMDELARLISDANHERWKKKMENKECCGSFEEQLQNFFHQACSAQGQQKGSQQQPNQQPGNQNKQR